MNKKGSTILVAMTIGFAAVIILGIILLLLTQEKIESVEKKEHPYAEFLPHGATEIKHVGNHWYEFEYKGQRFLLSSSTLGASGVVKLDQEIEE